MTGSGAGKGRTPVRGKAWKKSSTIASDKFEAVSRAIRASLGAEPVRFTSLVERVAAKLPKFEGSVAWYTITVLRELEVRGEVVRRPRPVLYSRAAGGRRRHP